MFGNPFVRDALIQMRRAQQRDRVVIYYPSESECTYPGCGHDEITNSKKRIDCTRCDARGFVTTWVTQIVSVRAVRPEPLSYTTRDGAVSVETAALVLYVDHHDRATIRRMRQEERAYFEMDGVTYRPNSITPVGVGGLNEYRVECEAHTPA